VLDFTLPFFCGIADRVEDDGVGKAGFYGSHEVHEDVRVLRGLRDHADLFQFRQAPDVLQAVDGRPSAVGVAQQAADFRVLFIADDEDGVIPGCVLPDDGLNVSHLRTGGIDNFQALVANGFSLLRGNSVGANHERGARPAGRNPLQAADGYDAPLSQQFDGLRVVDQGTVGVDRFRPLVPGHVQDQVHGPLYAHAESGRSG